MDVIPLSAVFRTALQDTMLQTAAQHFIAGMEGLGDSALSEEELFLACWHGVAYLDMAIFVAAI